MIRCIRNMYRKWKHYKPKNFFPDHYSFDFLCLLNLSLFFSALTDENVENRFLL